MKTLPRNWFHRNSLRSRLASRGAAQISRPIFRSPSMLQPIPDAAKQDCVDREAFNTTKKVAALRIPKQRCQELMNKFKGFTLSQPKLRCIVADGTRPDTRLLLLSDQAEMPEGLSEELKGFVAAEGFEVVKEHGIQLGYNYLSTDQALKALLPQGVDAPSSFETIGHIIHLNLRDNQLPFKYLIGRVLLDKNPHIKTVVNKVGNIDNTFRVFAMELLAGEPRTEAEVVQHGARFRLDMAQVYWNSRLEAEHYRLVEQYFKPQEVIADIMAGVGPFAIPAALQGCTVYANDLNPSSTHYLRINARLNRVTGAVHPFTLDGRAFVRLLCATPGYSVPTTSTAQQPKLEAESLQQQQPQLEPPQQQQGNGSHHKIEANASSHASHAIPQGAPQGAGDAGCASSERGGQAGTSARKKQDSTSAATEHPAIPEGFCPPPGGLVFQHAIMNLPASAIEFVDAFNGAFDPAVWKGRLPLVHLYTFKTLVQSEADVVARVEHIMGGRLESPPTIHLVRDVSPGKVMLCVTFRVPEAVAFNGREGQGGSGCVGTAAANTGVAAPRGEEGASATKEGDPVASEANKRQRT